MATVARHEYEVPLEAVAYILHHTCYRAQSAGQVIAPATEYYSQQTEEMALSAMASFWFRSLIPISKRWICSKRRSRMGRESRSFFSFPQSSAMNSFIGLLSRRYVSLGRIQETIFCASKEGNRLMFKRFCPTLFAVIPLCLFCAACTPSMTNGYAAPVPCLALDNDIPAHHVIPPQGIPAQARSSITVTWRLYKPSPDVQSPSTPVDPIRRATMQELLFGPFPSRDAVNHLSGQSADSHSRGPILASSRPIVASGCTAQSFASIMTLPKNLKPGYYDLYLTGSSFYCS